MTETSDFDLLEGWRAEDPSAAQELMRRHYDGVWRFFEIKAAYVAEDLTQQVFLAAVENRDDFRGSASFKSYLFGIARLQLLAHIRRRARGDDALRRWDAGGADAATTPSKLVAMAQEQRLLVLALERLPTDLQIATMLYYWEGMRGPEIGEVLGISDSAVRGRLARARELIRERVGKLTSGALRESLDRDFEAWARSVAGAPAPARTRTR